MIVLLMVTCSEDGDIRLRFFEDQEKLAAEFSEEEPPPRWLPAEEAAGDPNYWPKRSAFLAEVIPVRMKAEQVAVRWRVTPADEIDDDG